MNDVRYLVDLKSLGVELNQKQSSEVLRMIEDPRFSKTLKFREIVEVSLWHESKAKAFEEFWKDREYRSRFGFEFAKTTIGSLNEWGGVALRLAMFDYTKNLSEQQIVELAQPENQHWAKPYHQLCTNVPQAMKTSSHESLKQLVKEFGVEATNEYKRYMRSGDFTAIESSAVINPPHPRENSPLVQSNG